MKAHDGMYIGGEWRPASGQDTIAVVNPADEQVIGHVPAGTAEDVDAAVRAARAAFPGWAATPPAERAERIAALRDVLAARKDEIAETVTAELGSPLPLSQAVHAGCSGAGRRFLRRTRRLLLLRGEARQFDGPAGARRRRRRDHTLELPAPPDRREGGPRAGHAAAPSS